MATTRAEHESVRLFSSPQEEVLLSLMRSADCLHREFQQRLRPFGLTPTQYNVLRILRNAGSGGLTCTAIGRSMITPEPDITRLLARLKSQDLLTQARDPQDRRVLWTHIATAGLELLARLDGTVERAPREMFSELSCEEVRELTRLLNKAKCCRESPVLPTAALTAESSARQPSPRLPRLPHRPE
jgi:DNA-binding MarR family transcriptional regulator